MTTERTAPRSIRDCPPPVDPDAWKHQDGLPPRNSGDPHEAIEWAQVLLGYGERLRCSAAAALAESHGVVEAARVAGISVDGLQGFIDAEHGHRQRLEYSQAYYARHPDRTPGEWYPVEDGDPYLPDGAFGVRTRRTT